MSPALCALSSRPAAPARRRSGDAGRGRRARQHRAHRGGHGRDDRRQGHARHAALARARPARPSCSGRRWARCCCPRSWPAAAGAHRALAGLRDRRRRRAGRHARRRYSVLPDCCSPGTLLIGFGNTSNQLSRYANADMVPLARRASAIGLVVWAATVGSVIGPNARRRSRRRRRRASACRCSPARTSSRWCSSASQRVLSFVLLRPDPYELADRETVEQTCEPTDVADPGAAGPSPPVGARGVGLADRRPVRDGPDHDDDTAAHDRARPRPRGRGPRALGAHASGCSRCRRSPGG